MGIIFFTFLVIFGLIASGGLLLFHREEMLQRISDVINPRPKPKSLLSAIQQTGLSIGGVVEHFENVIPKSQAEVPLYYSGYRAPVFAMSPQTGSSTAQSFWCPHCFACWRWLQAWDRGTRS